jgi:BASS family bile acid:Na+ symporter
VVSSNKEKILKSGPAIFGVMVLYNSFGLLLGFLAAKVSKLPYEDQNQLKWACKTQV